VAIVTTEWLNANETRRYPLHDNAALVSRGGDLLPNNLLVDAAIRIPDTVGRVVYISSLGSTSGLFTLTLLAAQQSDLDDFPSSSSESSTFVPLAVLRVVKPVIPFRNYRLEAIYPGVGGWIALGSGANEQTSMSLFFDGPDDTQLLHRVVRAYRTPPVSSLGKEGYSSVLTGLIRLRGTAGVVRTYKSTRTIDGIERDVAVIGIDPAAGTETMTRLAGSCGGRPLSGTCTKAPIESINGVMPDEDGNIDIEFRGEETVGDIGKGMIIDYPIGIWMVEPVIGTDAGGPPEMSSSSYSESSDDDDDDEPTGSAVPGDSYCENFRDWIAEELVVRRGIFTVNDEGRTARYVSSPSVAERQVSINPNRNLDSAASYTVEAIIRPRSVATGNGHLIFGYKDIDDFFFAGLTLRPTTGLPRGRFYLGRVVGSAVTWDDGLGDRHEFLTEWDVPAQLIVTDYHVKVEIYQLGDDYIAKLDATWDDGTPRSLSQLYVLPSTFNNPGWAGLGTVAAETEFDNFGIDCPGFPLSSSSCSSSSSSSA
jgi:hypothetical protein